MAEIITRERFLAAVGRANRWTMILIAAIARAWEKWHFGCGWDQKQNLPRFMMDHVATAT